MQKYSWILLKLDFVVHWQLFQLLFKKLMELVLNLYKNIFITLWQLYLQIWSFLLSNLYFGKVEIFFKFSNFIIFHSIKPLIIVMVKDSQQFSLYIKFKCTFLLNIFHQSIQVFCLTIGVLFERKVRIRHGIFILPNIKVDQKQKKIPNLEIKKSPFGKF